MPGSRAFLLGTVLASLLLPAAAIAQGQATARVEPAHARPGEDLSLIFRVEPPDTAEIVVREQVTCEVNFPDDRQRSPCEGTGDVAEVRAAGSGAQTYVFAYKAPAAKGTYDVRFEADSTARVMPATYTATTSFAVTDGSPALDPAGEGGDGEPPDEEAPPHEPREPGPGTGGEGGDDGVAGLGDRDGAARLTASTTLATAVLVVGLVGNRFPFGGA